VVKILCAYSRSSNLIPFSPGGLRDPRVHQNTKNVNKGLYMQTPIHTACTKEYIDEHILL